MAGCETSVTEGAGVILHLNQKKRKKERKKTIKGGVETENMLIVKFLFKRQEEESRQKI